MRRVRCSIRIDGVIAVTVIGNDNDLITVVECGFDHFVTTLVDGLNGFHDRFIDAGMADHVAVREVERNIIELLRLNSSHEGFGHFRSRHLRLHVIGRHFRTRNQDTLLTRILGFATAVEEESHMGKLLGLGDTQLFHTQLAYHFAKRVLHVLFRIEDMQTLERRVVRRHAAVVEARDGLHALFRHILLRENNGDLFGAVVAVVKEDDYVAFGDTSITVSVY